MRNYEPLLTKFCHHFNDTGLTSITADGILSFLDELTKRSKQSTKRLRYSLLSAFFNFVKNSIDPNLENPCDSPMLKKIFKNGKPNQWKILDKEEVDEIIFRTENPRNRLMLELMARGGMRIGEVLKLTPGDIEDRKITLKEPKSGRQAEVVFIPQKVADRMKAYVRYNEIAFDQRIFPISYTAARVAVKKAGKVV